MWLSQRDKNYNKIWRIIFARWISMATRSHIYAEVQNNYCFSTAIMVYRKLLILRYTYIACIVVFFCFSFVVLRLIFQPFPLFYYVSSLYAPFSVSKISMRHYSLFIIHYSLFIIQPPQRRHAEENIFKLLFKLH